MDYTYPIALGATSALVFALEAVFPWRKGQKQLRAGLISDLAHLVFNGHFLSLILFGLANSYLVPWLEARGVLPPEAAIAAGLPLAAQIVIALLAIDVLQWAVHVMLHRVPFLWTFHKVHHSVVDGEMDWIVSFRFHWMEVVIYRSLLYVPLAFLGFHPTAVLVHAIFGTLIGHLNHSNLAWSYGPLRYLLNNPRMHVWHHDYSGDAKTTRNFGIIFSVWDYLFGTARIPAEAPARIGFPGVEEHPRDFLSHAAWPFVRKPRALSMSLGTGLLVVGWWATATPRPPAPVAPAADPPTQAASQPSAARSFCYAATPGDADLAIANFGRDAFDAGYAHPDLMVSADELARALGSSRLAILDVRPRQRFLEGHLPGAQLVERSDFMVSRDEVMYSRDRGELEALLRARGVRRGMELVLYGDGPESYRLWWTLRTVGGRHARVLDGGIVGWKAGDHPLEDGAPRAASPGDLELTGVESPVPQRWSELEVSLGKAARFYLDTRAPDEFSGAVVQTGAARGGHIPEAKNLPWTELLRDAEQDPRLLDPANLRAKLTAAGVDRGKKVVTYCQTGTRSSVAFFALLQLGFPADETINYEGSWLEYSRLPH